MKKNKGFTKLIIALILLGILGIGIAVYYLTKKTIDKKINIEEVQYQEDQSTI